MDGPGSVMVMGAGAIGCFVGGRLAAAGVPVSFIGRPRVLQALRDHGLRCSDLEHATEQVPAGELRLADHCAAAPRPALVLLCVKSPATAEAACELAAALPAGTLVISLQNGVANAEVARAAAPGLTILPGMVPFNVAELAPGHYHRGSSGQLAAQDDPALRPWLAAFDRAALPLQLHADLRAVQWAKLLMNLNNPVNALSGLPLHAQLLDRGYRQVLAALQEEALAALKANGIEPARLTPLPPARTLAVLRLPTWAFRLIASRMLRIDDKARSSMADDLALGRTTEIDALCGEVQRLAARAGLGAPLNTRIAALVERWPQAKQFLSSAELMAALGMASG